MTEQVIQVDETIEANQPDSKKSAVGGVMKAVLTKATGIVAKAHGMILKPFVFSVATAAIYGLVSAVKGEIPYSLSGIAIPLAIIGYFLWLAGEVISLKESIMEISEVCTTCGVGHQWMKDKENIVGLAIFSHVDEQILDRVSFHDTWDNVARVSGHVQKILRSNFSGFSGQSNSADETTEKSMYGQIRSFDKNFDFNEFYKKL